MNLAIVQYTDNVPTGFAGVTFGPWVRIRPGYKEDKGLLAHELLHVWQFWAAVLALFCWLPLLAVLDSDVVLLTAIGVAILALSSHMRLILMAEVDAYRVQLKVTVESLGLDAAGRDTRVMLFSQYISTKYGLDITPDAALKLLTE